MKRLLLLAAGVLTLALAMRSGVSQAALTDVVGDIARSRAFVGALAVFSLVSAAVAGFALWRARVARRRFDRMGALVDASLARQHEMEATAAATLNPPARATGRPQPGAGEPREPRPELLLQPIVSFSRNAVVAFDVIDEHAEGEESDPLAADRERLQTAAEAILLRPEALGMKSPLYVPVSIAFVTDPRAPSFMASLVRGKPSLARGLCLRLRTVPEGSALAALAAMAHGGIAVSASPRRDELASLVSAGITHMRVPASDLVDPYSARRIPAWQAVETARSAGLSVMAVGVAAMEDAARLLDEGIDLMSGPAFAEPKRLRALGEQAEPSLARHRAALRNG